MTESIVGVLIGGGIAIITSILSQWGSTYAQRKHWRHEKKAEALSNVLKFCYMIKNKGSKVIHGNPKGKVLTPDDMRELFRESAELKYWMANSEVYVSKKNKASLNALRTKMDESLILFHDFVKSMDNQEQKDEYQFDPNFGDEVLNKVIAIANDEL